MQPVPPAASGLGHQALEASGCRAECATKVQHRLQPLLLDDLQSLQDRRQVRRDRASLVLSDLATRPVEEP